MRDLRRWKREYVFHFRVIPTNDSINPVIPTDNSVYLYKYAFSRVKQYGEATIALTEHLALL